MTTSSQDTGVVLKACPHCGSPAFMVQMNGVYQAWCRRDMCARGPLHGSEAEAAYLWNTRTPESQHNV